GAPRPRRPPGPGAGPPHVVAVPVGRRDAVARGLARPDRTERCAAGRPQPLPLRGRRRPAPGRAASPADGGRPAAGAADGDEDLTRPRRETPIPTLISQNGTTSIVQPNVALPHS